MAPGCFTTATACSARVFTTGLVDVPVGAPSGGRPFPVGSAVRCRPVYPTPADNQTACCSSGETGSSANRRRPWNSLGGWAAPGGLLCSCVTSPEHCEMPSIAGSPGTATSLALLAIPASCQITAPGPAMKQQPGRQRFYNAPAAS